jgi:hypothetical protein
VCVPPSDGNLFSMASRDRHGLSGGSKTRSGYFGDLGGPSGGRDRREGSFLMRCAGLVACANRKNRQPVPGLGTDRGRRTPDQHMSEHVSRPCVRDAHRVSSARWQQGHLMARMTADKGEVGRIAAKREMVWTSVKVKWSRAGGKNDVGGRMRRREDGIAKRARCWGNRGAPAGCEAAGSAARIVAHRRCATTHGQGGTTARAEPGPKRFYCTGEAMPVVWSEKEKRPLARLPLWSWPDDR